MLALDQADRAFNAGNYDEAARGFENFLRIAAPGSEQTDRALFQLGLTYVLRPAPAVDWARAASTFKQLQDEHPDSPLRAQANLILSLHTEADQAAADLRHGVVPAGQARLRRPARGVSGGRGARTHALRLKRPLLCQLS